MDLLLENTTNIQENLENPIIKLGLSSTMDLEKIIPDFMARLRAYIGDDLMVEFSSYQLDEIGEKLAVGVIDCAFMFNVEGWSHPDTQRLPINRAGESVSGITLPAEKVTEGKIHEYSFLYISSGRVVGVYEPSQTVMTSIRLNFPQKTKWVPMPFGLRQMRILP